MNQDDPLVRSYDTFEELMEDMARNEEAALASTQPWQWEIGYGDYWVTYNPPYDVWIFGRIDTLWDRLAWWKEYFAKHADLDKDELSEMVIEMFSELETEQESFQRGYRYGTCYSTIEPRGEVGSTHVSRMVPIMENIFEQAKAGGWNITALDEELHQALIKSFNLK